MDYTVAQKADLIIEAVRHENGRNPVVMFTKIAENEYMSIHGPEHHILDGACLLMAYYNAGGHFKDEMTIDDALKKIKTEGLKMPGAACGYWGVCGAITSVGAALSIIDGTGPLSNDGTWGEHMRCTSAALGYMGEINGPRCCKRDAFIAFMYAIDYINAHYDTLLEKSDIKCTFSPQNKQCLKERCPFHC